MKQAPFLTPIMRQEFNFLVAADAELICRAESATQEELDYIVMCVNEHTKLVAALQLAERMCTEALPKFSWGASALDANAIDLLNRAPTAIHAALIGKI